MSDDENEVPGPALYIEPQGDEFDLDVPPTSGAEYLRRVQKEAEKCPEIVVAKIDRSAYKENQTVRVSSGGQLMPAPGGYAPSLVWQKAQIADFSQVRKQIALVSENKSEKKKICANWSARLPLRDDVEKWCRLCFGRLKPLPKRSIQQEESCDSSEDESDDGGTSGSPPLLSILLQMDQHTVHKVLEYHINWFEATGFSATQGQWLYALLVCLEKPLTPETCSSLRSLARNCANLRATIETPDDPLLAPLNLLICLIARYFDQMDLADH